MTRKRCLAAAIAAVAALGCTATALAETPLTLEVLGRLEIPAEGPGGFRISELSGLAWDADRQLLYAVSDNGALHHFRLRRTGGRLVDIEAVFSTDLSSPGDPASGQRLVNAEGLAALNSGNGIELDSELLVAFEDGPGISRFSSEGHFLGVIELSGALKDPASYAEENSRLEAVAFDPRHGIITAPEEALAGTPDGLHTIFAPSGAMWTFKTFQPHRSNFKALDRLSNGAILILERTRQEAGGKSTARLRYLKPDTCLPSSPCAVTEIVAWPEEPLHDNFEGMTQVSDTEFLLVTDRKKKDGTPAVLLHIRISGLP